MRHAEQVTFGTSGLDRAAWARGDTDALSRLLSDESGGVLPFWRGKPMFDTGSGELLWLKATHDIFAHAAEAPIFLGLDDERPRFAQSVPDWDGMPDGAPIGGFHDPSEQQHPAVGEDGAFAELRARMPMMDVRAAELAATAKAILGWHHTHRFCARCGNLSEPSMAGWQRNCPDCGGHHFPRTDPVVIMLITRGNSVLVGRSPGWPEGLYSLLAGFVEPGETIEAAVRRETFEEAGIRVGAVRYLSSQPWPFPSSLMFGCEGEALDSVIEVDPAELDDARWVTREEMVDVLTDRHDTLRPPRKGAIARFLVEGWLADDWA